jgi:hypothetical protein
MEDTRQESPKWFDPTGCCIWKKQRNTHLWIESIDNPHFCHYVPEKGSGFCQKHGMIAAELGDGYQD